MSQRPYLIEAPVSDDQFLSPSISQMFERAYISVTFFSDEYITPVTPTGGKVTFTATDDGFNYGTIDAGEVDATKSDYIRPNLSGRIQKIKALLEGVTGATHFRVVINGYS
ncbi:conserved hypothetical protein [Vibrio phage 242E40-1]|nr:conserved hypothetical protein [Vibrio phage 242E40-1]